ncbi:hypothetical protein Lalb_Chr23g0277501 [Lupinus albus]|uniref:Uncharacterized protein n=1 Tax=Lupinus albus TaxID=3870 RepID=A0A6A4ND46_LUPAL|nr:hypothetical protein Lalb_Chr23g0277501 [Lupinus albus]
MTSPSPSHFLLPLLRRRKKFYRSTLHFYFFPLKLFPKPNERYFFLSSTYLLSFSFSSISALTKEE